MKVSELFRVVTEAGAECRDFSVVLAQVDPVPGDSVDVDLADIGWVELNFEAGQARVFPRSAVTDDTPDQQVSVLDTLLQHLPTDNLGGNDLALVAELPLDRDGPGLILRRFVEIRGLHLGKESGEAWLLVNPKEEFGDSTLPA